MTDRTSSDPPGRHGSRLAALRPSPLRRTSDRLEALAGVLVVLALLAAIPVALAVATATYTNGVSLAAAETASRRLVTGRLLEDGTSQDGAAASSAAVATVEWDDRAGATQEGQAAVPVGARAGSTVRIWVDRQGDRAPPPATSQEAASDAVVFGMSTFVGIAALAVGAHVACRTLLDRGRMRRWEESWAAVEPIWTRTIP